MIPTQPCATLNFELRPRIALGGSKKERGRSRERRKFATLHSDGPFISRSTGGRFFFFPGDRAEKEEANKKKRGEKAEPAGVKF